MAAPLLSSSAGLTNVKARLIPMVMEVDPTDRGRRRFMGSLIRR
jgi:hypothetical protein